MPEEYSIHVKLKDFFFAESRLDFEGEQDLGKFPEKGLVEREEVVPSDLHRQG